MSATLLGQGGYGTVSASDPTHAQVLYLAKSNAQSINGDPSLAAVASDGAPCQAYTITNYDATNWLHVRVGGMHMAAGAAVVVGPGQTFIAKKGGPGMNAIHVIYAWQTAPGSAASGGNITVSGGIMCQG